MGTLTYDGAIVEFDDRVLAHLQLVIVQKLRRQEGFTLSWLDAVSMGGGRSAVWINHTIPLFFRFAGSRLPAISPEWLDRLGQSASTATGLVVVDEEGNPVRSKGMRPR